MDSTAPAQPAIAAMKPWRVWLVFGLIALLVIGHAIDVYAQIEHWPFSNYPMYARVEKKRRQELLTLVGLMREPGYRALVRLTDARYVPPMSEGRLRVILMSAYRRGEHPHNVEDAKRVMADYLRQYEARRVAGLHDGPRMVEIHLYRLTWKLRPDGSAASRPWKKEELLKLTWDELQAPSKPPVVPQLSPPSIVEDEDS